MEFNDPESKEAFITNDININHIDRHNVSCAWNITTGDPNISVAITDRYFSQDAQDIAGKFTIENNAGNCGGADNSNWHHGIQSAGIMSAIPNNNQGLAGTGHDITTQGYCYAGGVQNAAFRAFEDGHRIFSITVGFDPLTNASELTENGMVIIQSSNSDNRASSRNVPGVIHTGRAWENGYHRSYGDNQEEDIDCLIITKNMPRLVAYNSYYESGEGTSIGAPFLAGIVGLMRSVNPCLPPAI